MSAARLPSKEKPARRLERRRKDSHGRYGAVWEEPRRAFRPHEPPRPSRDFPALLFGVRSVQTRVQDGRVEGAFRGHVRRKRPNELVDPVAHVLLLQRTLLQSERRSELVCRIYRVLVSFLDVYLAAKEGNRFAVEIAAFVEPTYLDRYLRVPDAIIGHRSCHPFKDPCVG